MKSASFWNTTETNYNYYSMQSTVQLQNTGTGNSNYSTWVDKMKLIKMKLMKTMKHCAQCITLTLAFGGNWRAGWITTAKLSFVPYKPLFTSSSRRCFCWETIHKHYWGFVTQGKFSCNMSQNLYNSNATWKLPCATSPEMSAQLQCFCCNKLCTMQKHT